MSSLAGWLLATSAALLGQSAVPAPVPQPSQNEAQPASLAAQGDRAPPSTVAATQPAEETHVIEITFGSSQLFNHQSIVTKSGRVKEEIIPVTSALIMLEWLFHDRFSLASFFNLPLVTQKTVVDGEIREEFVAPSIALGARASALRLDVFAKSRLDLQIAALAGVTLGSSGGDTFFPLVAGRMHFSNQAGFTLYLGTAFAFRKDTVALLYGIGHRF
jgi:hypothetical protein